MLLDFFNSIMGMFDDVVALQWVTWVVSGLVVLGLSGVMVFFIKLRNWVVPVLGGLYAFMLTNAGTAAYIIWRPTDSRWSNGREQLKGLDIPKMSEDGAFGVGGLTKQMNQMTGQIADYTDSASNTINGITAFKDGLESAQVFLMNAGVAFLISIPVLLIAIAMQWFVWSHAKKRTAKLDKQEADRKAMKAAKEMTALVKRMTAVEKDNAELRKIAQSGQPIQSSQTPNDASHR